MANDIAVATPSLWTSICCDDSITTAAHLDIWLRRARTQPLCISLHGDLSRDVAIAVRRHGYHLQILKLQSSYQLEQMDPTSFLSLTKLTVVNATVKNTHLPECLYIFYFTPALVECDFTSVSGDTLVSLWKPTPFAHLSLRCLQLGDAKSKNAALLLKYLTLPALEILHVSDSDQLMPNHLASLLTRSLPPLQLLHVQGLTGRFDDLDEPLRLVPTLTDLTLKFREGIDPVSALKQSVLTPHLGFLPNLRNVHIHANFSLNVNYDVVVSALAARGAALRSFEVFSPFRKPDHHIIATLKEFAGDHGTHIYVGSRKHNYIPPNSRE
ncbi:hypothetical protein MSAN_01758200 [Mycena sanguinolenta]|uniref:Uncharacterized protein n=1 Tax=Mycena sanguinolenta TaxID=230812 RepID=A0A8H7CUN8_9AGAR|nr:hypothetical protein MSAN_01758200 [Mycena sanguinolenta]